MKLKKFKKTLRLNRGRLTNLDVEMGCIFDFGTDGLIDFALNKKLLGVVNIAEMALSLSHEEQDDFIEWVAEKGYKAPKQEVYLKYHEAILRTRKAYCE